MRVLGARFGKCILSFYHIIIFTNMERRKEQNVNDVVRLFLAESGLETPLLQYRAVQNWKDIVPAVVAEQTYAMEIRGEVLFVKVLSPSLATELQLQRSQLTAKVNASVQAHIVSDIRFVL